MHESQPSNIDAGMLRIWLEAVSDEYERTLVAIQSLRGQLDDPSVTPAIRRSIISRSNALINENNLLENRNSQIQPQIRQLLDQGAQLVEQERARALPIESELGALNGQLNAIDRDLSFLASDLLHIQQHSPGHANEHLIVNRIQNLRFNRRNIVASGNAISNQLAAINNRALQIKNDFGQQVKALENELSGIQRDLRKNNRELGRIAEGPTVASGKKTSRTIELRGLKTYYPFPTELYRAELIERFLN